MRGARTRSLMHVQYIYICFFFHPPDLLAQTGNQGMAPKKKKNNVALDCGLCLLVSQKALIIVKSFELEHIAKG